MKPHLLRLAAIQMVSANGRIAENLARVGQWAEQAARQGAELVLLPELFSTGFEINANAWSAAEPQGGPTERWLTETARRHGFYIGGSYLERRGDDFFNTFALSGPMVSSDVYASAIPARWKPTFSRVAMTRTSSKRRSGSSV
jgi:N-carbamoylputrescine amidase